MARRNFNSTDLYRFLNNNWPTVGQSSFTGTTRAIALSIIEATDTVIATVTQSTTASYVVKAQITAGIGFTVTLSAASPATVSYAVFKQNS